MDTRTFGANSNARAAATLVLAGLALTGCWPSSDAKFNSTVMAERPWGEREELPAVKPDEDGPTPPAPPHETGPLDLSIDDAILLALEQNQAFRMERLAPARSATFESEAAAEFHPVLRATPSYSASRWVQTSGVGTGTRLERSVIGADAELSVLSPYGTRLGVVVAGEETDTGATGNTASALAGVELKQPLLRGRGTKVNLAELRQARLDTKISEYELRGVATALVADVEHGYWDYNLARSRLEIYTESLRLAEQHLKRTEEQIDVGRLAKTERAAARAEVASQREALIGARGEMEIARLRLLRLLNPADSNAGSAFWSREVKLQTQPAEPEDLLDPVATHVDDALATRADVNQAKLSIARGDLELVRTRNGLLPRLDLFVNLGKTGYADSFGKSVEDLDGRSFEALVGVTMEWPLGRRAAHARNERALLDRREAALALDNLQQLAELDVRIAYITATTAREQIEATRATRELKEEALRVEVEKLDAGKSTAFQVSQAQRDVVESKISEVRAVIGYLKALVDLHRLDGSLLQRRGIRAPGAQSYATGAKKK